MRSTIEPESCRQHRYFIYLAYDGTLYHGWQRQPNAVSVQQCLEDCLRLLFSCNVNAQGAGRTDTGVHARLMVAHIDVEKEIDTEWLKFKLNCLLPQDISVYTVVPVTQEGHARFSARARTYHYYMNLRKDPFRRAYACRFFYPLDFARMNEAAARLLEHTDFASFCKSHSDNKTTFCHITEARWIQQEEGLWCFVITADRFLRNMVRAIVGTLIEVGKGHLSPDDFERVMEEKDRQASGESMPANGLFLENIVYPDEIFLSGKAPKIF